MSARTNFCPVCGVELRPHKIELEAGRWTDFGTCPVCTTEFSVAFGPAISFPGCPIADVGTELAPGESRSFDS
jgi:hypothetical protein